MSQIRQAIVFACSLAAVSGVAHAEDHAVLRRLSSNGKLTSSHAKQLASKVTQRLARAADAPPNAVEPLRAALSQALLGSPMAPDQISAAKVRLKLYAGLNEFALESIFAPRKGAVATCERDTDFSKKECEALVAAAGKMPLSKVKRVAAGPASPPLMAAAPVAQQAPMAAAPAQGGSRFGGGRFNSGAPPAQGGWQGGQGQGHPQQQQAYPQQQQQAYPQQQQGYAQRAPYPQQQQQQGYAPQQGSRFGGAAPAPQQGARFASAAPVAQPGSRFGGGAAPVAQPVARPVAAAPAPAQVAMRPAAPSAAPAYVAAAPAAPAVSPADAEARKEAYKAQREAYMARQKQIFEEKRAKALGANAPPPAAEPKPAPAQVAKAAPKEAEPETPLDADMKAAVGEAAAPAAGGGKAGLDGEFLDGLLDDPMGGNKKK